MIGFGKIRRAIAALVTVSFLAGAPVSAVEVDEIDWTAVLRALGVALDSWRLSPFPRMTPTPTNPPATDTPTPTNTPTFTQTRTPTFTPTLQPTQTNLGQLAFGPSTGLAPAQRLASAFLVFPYVVHSGSKETLVTLINMAERDVRVNCFFIKDAGPVLGCLEVGFSVNLTPLQPFSWYVGDGTNNPLTFTAAPPFDGVGELKCAVDPEIPDLDAHNVLQGRATVFDDDDGDTVAYGAIGFQRRVPGHYSGVISLDGFTYDQCPERLHFQVLAQQSGSNSSLILTPCEEDLLTQTPTSTVVQMQIVNEFEQVFSSSRDFTCLSVLSFSSISTLRRSTLGTDTAHLVLRGVSSPLVGMVIDRFTGGPDNSLHSSANDPYLEGGRRSTVIFP